MKYGKNDLEWQTSIQGMSFSDFWDYLNKREWSFKWNMPELTMMCIILLVWDGHVTSHLWNSDCFV